MKKSLTFLIIVVIPALLFLVFFSGENPLKVTAAKPKIGMVEQVVSPTSSAIVDADRKAVISAEISAKVIKINKQEGQKAREGENIIELDDQEPAAEKKVIQEDINTTNHRIEQAKMKLKKITDELERITPLKDKEIVAKNEYDRLKNDEQIARKETEILSSILDKLKVSLELSDLKLQKTKISAPFDGIITKVFVKEGESTQPAKPVFSVIDPKTIIIKAQIDEVDITKVKIGNPARIQFEIMQHLKHDATVVGISPIADIDQKSNRTIEVKLKLLTQPDWLVIGTSAQIEIITDQKESCFNIPTQWILNESNQKRYVYVANNGRAYKKYIETGIWNWDHTEVSNGIMENDLVINPLLQDQKGTLNESRSVEITSIIQ